MITPPSTARKDLAQTDSFQRYPTDAGGVIITCVAILPTCRLKKMSSACGRWRYKEETAFVGKLYPYSPASRKVATILHQPTGEEFECEIVYVFDDRGLFAMMPTECLDFPIDFNPPTKS